MTSGNSSDNILHGDFSQATSCIDRRKARQYDAYKADLDKLDLDIINAKIALAKLLNEKKILQLAGLDNYDYIT